MFELAFVLIISKAKKKSINKKIKFVIKWYSFYSITQPFFLK
jgi:hypothetical protein